MQYLSPPDSPTSELEVEEAGAAPPGEGSTGRGRKLTEAQEHYSKQHADWLPQPLKSDLSIAASSPAGGVTAAPTTASARKSRFGLLVPASPAFVAGGSLHSTSTQNKAVLLPPTLSASPSSASSTGASPSPSGGSFLSSPATTPGAGAAGASKSTAGGSPPGGIQAATYSPLNIDSRTGLNPAAAAGKTRVLIATGGLSGSGVVKTLENSAGSAAAGALVAAAFGRGAAVTGSTPQSAKFAAAAAAAEAAARAAAAGRTEKGLPPDALVDGLPVQSFSHLRVMKEGTCVEVFCLPLLFQQARSSGRLILGRAEAADIPTEHPSCSRLHCELRRMPVAAQESGTGSSGAASSSRGRFTYMLKDLGSGHGTLINGGRVAAGKDTALEDEDEIQLGFSQRLYLFFTGRDTFGPDLPPPPKEPQSKNSPYRQAHMQQHGPRTRLSSSSSSSADAYSPTAAAPIIPAPPCIPPPPAPPTRHPGDEVISGQQQQQQQLQQNSGIATGQAGDSFLWTRPSEIEQQSSESRWRAYQHHMEQLHQQRVTSLGGGGNPSLPYCLPAASADAEQATLQQQQQQHAFLQQQQQDAYAEDVGSSSGCSGMSATASPVTAGGGGVGVGGWGWEAAQQQQLLYWQQQQQQQQHGLGQQTGWDAGQQEQMWNAANLQEHGMHQYMAEQYAHEQQCWDAAALQQQQQCASSWTAQLQQQPGEESYAYQQHQQRPSGWSPLSSSQSYAEGEQQEEYQQCDGRQQQQQQGKGQWHPSFAAEGRDSIRGRGGHDGRGAAAAAGAGGGVSGAPFKRRASTTAARKLLWQHAAKKQQGDESFPAAAEDAASVQGNENKRLRLDGAKVALWAHHDGAAVAAAAGGGGVREQPRAVEGEEEGGGAAGLPGAACNSSSSWSVSQASSAAEHPPYLSSSAQVAAPAASQSSGSNSNSSSSSSSTSNSSSSIESSGEEGTTHRVFCAHILLSFVRRIEAEPWKGSSSSNPSNSGVLLGRGGRVVTRSRSDALSSLKSVKDITAEDSTQFGEFAAELSDCPSSKKRGVLGWVHAGLPGGRPPTLQHKQQQQTPGSSTSSSSSQGREQQHPPHRRTATEVAAQGSVDVAALESSSSSKNSEDKQEDWWLPQEAVEAALQLQVGELSAVVESEHGAHLLLRLK